MTKNERIEANLARLVKVSTGGMSKAQKDDYINELANAVREADLFRVKSADAEKGRALLERFIEERMDPQTKRDLEAALRTMDRAKLEAVLRVCDANGYITSLVRQCRELLGKVIDADAALAFAMKEMKVEFLKKALEMADAFGYDVAVVKAARKMLKNVVKAEAGIRKATKNPPRFKHSLLEKVVKFCASFGYDQTAGAKRVAKLLKRVAHARKLLVAAWDAVEQGALEEAVAACDKEHFDGSNVYRCTLEADCRQLLARVTKINEETEKATEQCIEHQVRTIVTAADEINMHTRPLDALRDLVNGDYAAFLDRQFKCAKRCKHDDRAIRVLVKRKDLLCERDGGDGALAPARCATLKRPHEWASEKLFGNKEKWAGNMLRWQDAALHAPLTTCAGGVQAGLGARLGLSGGDAAFKDARAKIFNNFDTVRKFMGQKNTKKMPLRLRELLVDCIACVPARDEAYLAVVKQCAANPNAATALPRAFELLALMLTAFPPTDALADILHAFVRAPESASHGEPFNCKGLLARAMYQGPAPVDRLPHESAFATQCEYKSTESFVRDAFGRRKYADGALATVLEGRLNLDAFEEPTYTRQNASWCELRLRRSSISDDVHADVKRDW